MFQKEFLEAWKHILYSITSFPKVVRLWDNVGKYYTAGEAKDDSITWNMRFIRGGADKSLVRPTSRCRRTESMGSLERGVCSCAELQVFSCYRGWKEARQATRAISTIWRRKLSLSFFFFARKGAEGNSRHPNRNIRGTCTNVCHSQKLGCPV